ncbi:MAG: hypothetical protein O3A76_16630 [Chloroflexi bacterium]|nr:hypothetical protein [Chloroflexota bacterium]
MLDVLPKHQPESIKRGQRVLSDLPDGTVEFVEVVHEDLEEEIFFGADVVVDAAGRAAQLGGDIGEGRATKPLLQEDSCRGFVYLQSGAGLATLRASLISRLRGIRHNISLDEVPRRSLSWRALEQRQRYGVVQPLGRKFDAQADRNLVGWDINEVADHARAFVQLHGNGRERDLVDERGMDRLVGHNVAIYGSSAAERDPLNLQ